MKKAKKAGNCEFDLGDMRAYMKMPAEEKLDHLRETALALNRITPSSSRKMWARLKSKGF